VNAQPDPAAQSPPSVPVTQAAAEGRDLFPLVKGRRWHYDVEAVRGTGEPEKLTAVRSIQDTRAVAGVEYSRIVTEVTGGTLRVPEQLYRADAKGVFAAVQGAEGKELLVLPADPATQKAWKGEAKPSINQFSGGATLGETFKHADREYTGCVKVVLTMGIPEKSFFGGATEVPVRMERWFAPGIGLVREVRTVGQEGKANYLKTDSKLARVED